MFKNLSDTLKAEGITQKEYGVLLGISEKSVTNKIGGDTEFTYSEFKKTIEIIRPKLSMWQLIVKKMLPPTRLMRYCCTELKETYGEGELLVTGVRAAESKARKDNGGLIKILDSTKKAYKFYWSSEQIIFNPFDLNERAIMVDAMDVRDRTLKFNIEFRFGKRKIFGYANLFI